MKLKAILTAFFAFVSITLFAQTYATLPYATSFESGSLDASWTTQVQGSGGNLARVNITTADGPYHGSYHMTMDKNSSNTNYRTAEAWLHLNLSGQTEVTLSFYYKDFGDENDTGADGDGIFFSADSGDTFTEVFHINPENYTDNVWQKITLDVDVLAAGAGLALTDSFVVKFQQRDNNSIDVAALGGSNVTDGAAFDSVYVRVGGALTPGRISGNDTICGGATSVSVTNVELPTEGDNTYNYTWQYSTNFATWNTIVVPSAPNLTFNNPPSGIFWVRRGVSSPSTAEGPVYTTASMIFITSPTFVNFYGLEATYCSGDIPETLSGSPPGGSFSGGLGLSGSTFTPGSAPTSAGGTVSNITYTYTDAFGCTYDTIHSTTVFTSPSVTITDLGAYLETQSTPVTMDGMGSPAGGVESYVGPGVAGNEFTPSASGGPGTKVITYTYTASNGCAASATIDAEVTSSGAGSISGLASSYCVDDNSNYPISASAPTIWGIAGVPNGFTGPGVTPGTNTTATFNPSAAGVGSHVVIFNWTWLGYPQITTQTVTINPRPTVYWTAPKYSYCTSDPVTPLTGWYLDPVFGWQTVSGTFMGAGISGSNFDASAAGVGSHNISFSYTDASGCSNTYTQSVNVYGLPAVSFSGLNPSYCKDEPASTLSGSPVGGAFSGSGISGSTFNPSIASNGSQNVTYTYTDGNGCSNSDVQATTVNPLPVLTMTGFSSSLYCEDAAAVNIAGFENGNPAPLGSFGGPSPGLVDNGNGTATFTPSAVTTTDTTYEIYFTYTDGSGCFDTNFRQITVAALPEVYFTGLSPQYCISDDPVTLFGNEPLGAFSGTGISGSTFDPGVSAGTHNITFTYTDPNGCTNDTTRPTTVFALPSVSFTGLNAEYCKDDVLDTLVGNQAGGYFEGVQAGTIFNDSSFLDVGNSGFAPETSYGISFSYVDVNGCFNADTQYFVVHPLPVPNFTGLSASYCEDDAPASSLLGTVNASHPYGFGSSSFFGQQITAISNTGTNQGSYDPTQVPMPSPGADVLDTISFVYVDTKGCRDTIRKATVVHGLPVVSAGFADSTMCTHDNGVFVNTQTFSPGTSTFYLEHSGAPILGGFFDPGSNNNRLGLNEVIFEFEDDDGCINYDTTRVIVYPPPVVDFELGSFCNDDSISFFDSSSIAPFDIGVNDDIITDWYWTFGDGGDDTIQNPQHQYIVPTTYNIQLTVTTREGCEAALTQSELVGEPPVANFQWDNVCFGETLQFTDYSTAQAVDPIANWSWDFDDGNMLDNSVNGFTGTDPVAPADQNGGITNGSYSNPSHQYQVINSYNVRLALETGSGCVDTLVKTLHIRPVIDTYPYSEDFETGNNGWFAGGQTAGLADSVSWELGVANGFVIKDSTANTSWVTNLNGDHNNNEQSYVDGPCFDFTNLTRPMIKMNIWSDMLEGSDGVILQSSTDNGATWDIVGEIGDGINWYNRTSISGNPGNQPINQMGWSFQDSTWIEARHDLDSLIGEPQVRLRLAFGSDATSANEGLAFDNIWVGERSRITLLEYFTNASDGGSVQDDSYIDDLVYTNRKDVVDIQYHTEFPGNDEMNNHNPADPSARALFYGAFNIGRAVLNGNAYNGVSSAVTTNDIKLQMLRDSPYSLTVGYDINGDDLTATAYLTAREDIDNADVTVHLAVVEDQITAITGGNLDTEFRSVLKKMLPSATGTIVKRSFTSGDEEGVQETWKMANVFDVDELNVVAFVQDNQTDEVYQVTTTDTSSVPPVVVPPLSTEEFTANEELKLRLLPNPANRQVTVLFNQMVNNAEISFIDQFGRVVDQFHAPNAMEYISFELNYPSGVYYVRVVTNDKVITQKLVIEK